MHQIFRNQSAPGYCADRYPKDIQVLALVKMLIRVTALQISSPHSLTALHYFGSASSIYSSFVVRAQSYFQTNSSFSTFSTMVLLAFFIDSHYHGLCTRNTAIEHTRKLSTIAKRPSRPVTERKSNQRLPHDSLSHSYMLPKVALRTFVLTAYADEPFCTEEYF